MILQISAQGCSSSKRKSFSLERCIAWPWRRFSTTAAQAHQKLVTAYMLFLLAAVSSKRGDLPKLSTGSNRPRLLPLTPTRSKAYPVSTSETWEEGNIRQVELALHCTATEKSSTGRICSGAANRWGKIKLLVATSSVNTRTHTSPPRMFRSLSPLMTWSLRGRQW